ncbi:MAG TPA: S8 family serine peptidase [Asanoa sp.]
MRIRIDVAGGRTTMIRAVATLGALAAFGALPATSAAAQPAPGLTLRSTAPTGPAAVPGEIVVGFRSGVDGGERAAARSAADVHAERNLLARGVQLVKVDGGQTVEEAITALEKRSDVRFAEPNWIYRASQTTPDDPMFGSLWGLNNAGQAVNGHAAGTADDDIDAPEAWDRSTGSASTVVGVVDSGVAADHPDLAPNIWTNSGEIAGNSIDDDGNGMVDDVHGWDFVGDSNDPWDYDDHGTHVAGTIAARGNNGVGVTGVAWQASIMPARALNALGSGSNADIADAFTYAAANGAKVVNASLGGPAQSQAISDAITDHPNTLFVVAAGNGGADGIGDDNDVTPTYPCNYTAANLLCVGATDNNDSLANFSNYGATSVDLAAPGVDIDSTRPHSTDSFTDDFESGLGKWTVQSGPWGTRNIIGTTWLTDSPGAMYTANANWAIRTASKVDIGARSDCVLKFTYGTFLAAGDLLRIESSADDTTWTAFGVFGDTRGAVRPAAFELGAVGSRYYRFHLTSNASGNDDGVYIDNVRLACPGGTYGSSDYQFLDGTSMASPHVAGAAAVIFSLRPSAPVAKVKAALLDSGDAVPALTTKTVSGRRLNLNAALTTLLTKADTTTSITSDAPDPSVVGQAVTVQYGVAVTGLDNAPPSGTVTVSDGTQSCTGTVAAGACSIAFATAGPRSLTATYSGDDDHNASPPSASVSHQVNAADTTATISSDTPDPSVVGQAVTVQYGVSPVGGSGTPTGNVTVSDGTASCTGTVALGRCTLTLRNAGVRTLTATYTGSGSYSGSTSSGQTHTVNRAGTTTMITADGPDPSAPGAAVTVRYTVAVNRPGAGTPTGNVTVGDGVNRCTASVAAGRCTLGLTVVGSRALTARYAGDGRFRESTSGSAPHTVNQPSPPLAHVSGAKQTHRTFRVSAKPRLAQTSRRRPPVGTTFTYTLDRPATVRFDFAQPGAGRTVNGRCVPRRKHNRHKPKCALLRGSLTFAGQAGLNSVRFKGWLSRTKKLRPGRHALVITAITPGAGSTSEKLGFRIVR